MELDVNHDGKISDEDLDLSNKIESLKESIRKHKTQERMAWVALITVILITVFTFLPFIPDSRITIIGAIVPMFYIAMAGIISTYMGVTAWLSK